MLARVKEDCRLPAVRACGGVMFVKSEWTEVPDEHTLDALTHEMLEIKPIEVAADEPEDVNPPDDEAEIKPIAAEVVTEVAPELPAPMQTFTTVKKGGKR